MASTWRQKTSFYGVAFLINASCLIVLAGIRGGGWFQTNTGVAAYATPVSHIRHKLAPAIKSGTPTHVTITALGIDLNVKPGNYDPATNDWTLDNSDAFFATPSALVNDTKGNSLIYGHAIHQIFGKLPQLTVGSELIVTTDNGHLFHYLYSEHHDVDPTDTSIFSYNNPPTVTLQTCGGGWDQVRSMYTFNFQKVDSV